MEFIGNIISWLWFPMIIATIGYYWLQAYPKKED